MVERCKAVTTSGKPCGAQARRDGWCPWHDPQQQAEMAEARRRGGQARSNKARARKQLADAAMSPAEIAGLLSVTLRNVITGQTEPGVANAAATVARALIAVQEAHELDERLGELARQVAELTGRRSA